MGSETLRSRRRSKPPISYQTLAALLLFVGGNEGVSSSTPNATDNRRFLELSSNSSLCSGESRCGKLIQKPFPSLALLSQIGLCHHRRCELSAILSREALSFFPFWLRIALRNLVEQTSFRCPLFSCSTLPFSAVALLDGDSPPEYLIKRRVVSLLATRILQKMTCCRSLDAAASRACVIMSI